jgi:hypothetical protein
MVAHQLLASLQTYFAEHGDRADTKSVIAALNEAGDFADVNYGRGLTPHYVAKLLKPYGIEPRSQKMPDGKVLRGYSQEDCEQAFSTYVFDSTPQNPVSKRYSATKPENIDQNGVFENATEPSGSASENAVPASVYPGGSGVAFPEGENGGGDTREVGEPATEKVYV